ncbi:hypothetical protein SAMN02910298_00871 [Pseudobutyrivibrio sp. YE44]|uniref:NusG domain II-containing protein n=1 Tax=Pseudobutyrivibrio sp. YE44 TaxID=1520802 RepID=UPI00088EB152|nr:NusG domain II-containing protein [Pseudobutyrivibrio sp. YE44]SDB19191.1 hypothetical protein SAMN02910298_00871 [Pseudobutyrivibrio sp. YE44]
MKKNDFILIGTLLVIAFAIMIGMRFWQKYNTGDNPMVVITIDGIETQRLPLNEDGTCIITSGENGSNELIIKDGQASISDANCPDKICAKHRPISLSGESIVCLPHKVVVSIEGGEESEVDAIAQ